MGGPNSGRRTLFPCVSKIAFTTEDWEEFARLAKAAGDTYQGGLREVHRDGLPIYRERLKARGIKVE